MISFIVIGKNVEHTIEKCIASISRYIEANKIEESEIVYVDSDSRDRSIELAKKFPIDIIKVEGNVNSAIGRNIGVKYSKGNILFFVDGDMEILPDFHFVAFNADGTLIYPFISAAFQNIYYTANFKNKIGADVIANNINKNHSIFRNITGGLFLVERNYWERLNGMDSRLASNEDNDIGLRMSFIGKPQMYFPYVLMARHHTVSYYNFSRLISFLFSSRLLSPGILIRKHMLNKKFWPFLLRSRYFLFLFVFASLVLTLYPQIGIFFFLLYLFFQVTRIASKRSKKLILFNFLFNIFYDIYTLAGLIFYFPKKNNYRVYKIS